MLVAFAIERCRQNRLEYHLRANFRAARLESLLEENKSFSVKIAQG
jgi:hypothetical protein